MKRAHALYKKYFGVYLVVKWMLIVAALAFAPKILGALGAFGS